MSDTREKLLAILNEMIDKVIEYDSKYRSTPWRFGINVEFDIDIDRLQHAVDEVIIYFRRRDSFPYATIARRTPNGVEKLCIIISTYKRTNKQWISNMRKAAEGYAEWVTDPDYSR